MSTGAERIRALVEPVAAELGLEVLDVELLGSTPRQVLRITLDSPSDARPVSVADCEAVSRRMGDVLDAEDEMGGRYMLEVSSPGVNRPLKKAEHFRRVVGGRIRMRTAEPIDGARNFAGRLVAFEDDVLVVETDEGRRLDVERRKIEKANFEYEFPIPQRPGRRR